MKYLLNTGLLKLLPKTILCLFLAYMGIKVMDFILGLLKAWKNGDYKSSKMRDGIIRWIAELCAIVLIIGMDFILGLKFYLCAFTLCLFIYKEIGSVLENLGKCGVELPKEVKTHLEVFNVEQTGKLPVEIDSSKEVKEGTTDNKSE